MGVFLLINQLSGGCRTPKGEWWTFAVAGFDGVRTVVFGYLSLCSEQPTQNWSGQGESDCLIKTKHCDGLKRC